MQEKELKQLFQLMSRQGNKDLVSFINNDTFDRNFEFDRDAWVANSRKGAILGRAQANSDRSSSK